MPYTRVNDLGPIRVTVFRPFPKAYGVQVLVHSNDHPPAHIHVQADGQEARYSWPEMALLKNDKPLPGSAAKGLKRYIEDHGEGIRIRVEAVYGSHAV
jgi:hypothetical protein